MKLNYAFSKREIALILALVLVLVGLLYYRFVYLGISSQTDQYDSTDLEAQIQMEQLQIIEWQKMQDEIIEVGPNTDIDVPSHIDEDEDDEEEDEDDELTGEDGESESEEDYE